MAQNQDLRQTGAHIVVVTDVLDLIKDFSQYSKPVHSVLEVVKKLLIHVQIAMVKEINKPQKKYQLLFQRELTMGQELD